MFVLKQVLWESPKIQVSVTRFSCTSLDLVNKNWPRCFAVHHISKLCALALTRNKRSLFQATTFIILMYWFPYYCCQKDEWPKLAKLQTKCSPSVPRIKGCLKESDASSVTQIKGCLKESDASSVPQIKGSLSSLFFFPFFYSSIVSYTSISLFISLSLLISL
jgi:hypothetical protein